METLAFYGYGVAVSEVVTWLNKQKGGTMATKNRDGSYLHWRVVRVISFQVVSENVIVALAEVQLISEMEM
jgi:hypothetical protein